MTQLRDARLQEALAHAPDKGLRPSADVRERVRQQAHRAVGTVEPFAAPPWWQRAWQAAGRVDGGRQAVFATLLLATLVTVIWWDAPVPPATSDSQLAQASGRNGQEASKRADSSAPAGASQSSPAGPVADRPPPVANESSRLRGAAGSAPPELAAAAPAPDQALAKGTPADGGLRGQMPEVESRMRSTAEPPSSPAAAQLPAATAPVPAPPAATPAPAVAAVAPTLPAASAAPPAAAPAPAPDVRSEPALRREVPAQARANAAAAADSAAGPVSPTADPDPLLTRPMQAEASAKSRAAAPASAPPAPGAGPAFGVAPVQVPGAPAASEPGRTADVAWLFLRGRALATTTQQAEEIQKLARTLVPRADSGEALAGPIVAVIEVRGAPGSGGTLQLAPPQVRWVPDRAGSGPSTARPEPSLLNALMDALARLPAR